MYTIQGERKGEVGDNETLKTVNFQYPFHELDATRKLQAAKVKADAKAKGLDDKEVNKALKFTPKINEVNFIGQNIGNKQIESLYGGYMGEIDDLKKTGQLTPFNVRQVQMKYLKEADQLNNAMKGVSELGSALQRNLQASSTDPNVDQEEMGFQYKSVQDYFADQFDKDPKSFFNVNARDLGIAETNIKNNSFVNPDSEKIIQDGATKIGEELVSNEWRNQYGGTDSLTTKNAIQNRVNQYKQSQYENPENLKYFAKKYKQEQKNLLGSNYVSISNQDLFQDKKFQDYAKKGIDNSVDNVLSTEKIFKTSIDNKEDWGSGYSKKYDTKWKVVPTEVDYGNTIPTNFISTDVDVKNGEKIGGTVLTGSKGNGLIKFTHPQSGKIIIDGKQVSTIPAQNNGTFTSLSYQIGNKKNANLTSIKAVQRVLSKQGEDKGLDWSGLNEPNYANGNSEFTGIEKFINSKPKEERAKYAKAFTDNFTFIASVSGTIEDKEKSTTTEVPSKMENLVGTERTTNTQGAGSKSIVSLYNHSEFRVPKTLVTNTLDIRDGDKEMAKLDAQEQAFLRIDKLSKQAPEEVVKSGQAGSQNQTQKAKEAKEIAEKMLRDKRAKERSSNVSNLDSLANQ